tara:strand:+ start:189 stop:395 length:207 start_codon:yes stop_codon:yes gene_type:complete
MLYCKCFGKSLFEFNLRNCWGDLIPFWDDKTFPLWYVQEIEGYHADVGVLCTSYFKPDFYVDQIQRKA